MQYTVLLTQDEDGYWIAEVPALSGCVTFGKTRDEALAMAKDAAEGWIETRRNARLAVPPKDIKVELAAVEVG